MNLTWRQLRVAALALLTAWVLPSESAAQGPGAEFVRQVIQRAERASPRLMRALSDARRRGLTGREACLDRTLTEVHSALRQIRARESRFERARSEEERQRHRRALALLDARVRRLADQGRACAGEDALRSDEVRVEVIMTAAAPSGSSRRAPHPRAHHVRRR